MLCVTDASCILPLLCVQELTTGCMSQTLLMFYHYCVYRSYQQTLQCTVLAFPSYFCTTYLLEMVTEFKSSGYYMS